MAEVLGVGLQALVLFFSPQVKEGILKTKNQISLCKSSRRPSGPLLLSGGSSAGGHYRWWWSDLLRKHVKTAFYNINMYKYITYTHTRSDTQDAVREHKKETDKVHEAMLAIPVAPRCASSYNVRLLFP